MKHSVNTVTLSRFTSYRKATIRSIAISVLRNEKIITTMAKAKVARRAIDKIISLGKDNTLASRRRAFSLLCDHALVKVLFDAIGPKFSQRPGGYTRIIPYRFRRGDNAQLVILELTERYKEKKQKKEPKPEKAQKAKVAAPAKEAPAAREEAAKEQPLPTQEELVTKLEEEYKHEEMEKDKAPVHKKEPEQKKVHEPEAEPRHAPKKITVRKPDEHRPQKFLGGLKRFFKKGDPR